MIDGIKAGVGAVDGMKERQKVYTAEDTGKRALEKFCQGVDAGAGEPVYVGDELNLIPHVYQIEGKGQNSSGVNFAA